MPKYADMSPDEFRRTGHEVVDWIADYLTNIRETPVLPDIQPGGLIARLPANGPAQPESIDRILEDFRRLIVPASTHWNHPHFHAYFANLGLRPRHPRRGPRRQRST